MRCQHTNTNNCAHLVHAALDRQPNQVRGWRHVHVVDGCGVLGRVARANGNRVVDDLGVDGVLGGRVKAKLRQHFISIGVAAAGIDDQVGCQGGAALDVHAW